MSNLSMSMAKDNNEVKAKPQGKRKITIEKILDKARKQVTFSKRRKGIFKKASELCTLCNTEIAVVTFSGAGKVYSFGHPSAHDIINRYVYGSTSSSTSLVASSKATNEHINQEKSNTTKDNSVRDLLWWEKPIEGLGLEELEQYMAFLKELRYNVASKIGNYSKMHASTSINQSDLDLNKAYNPLINGNDLTVCPPNCKPN